MSVVGNEPVSTDNLKAALEAGGGVSRDTLFHGGDYNKTNYSDTFLGSLSDFSELVIGLMNTYGSLTACTVPAVPCEDKAISGSSLTSSSGTLRGTLTIIRYEGYFNVSVKTSAPTHVFEVIGVR